MKRHSAYRVSDQMFCPDCGRSWDVGDPDVPPCGPVIAPLRPLAPFAKPAIGTKARADLEARTLRLLREVSAELDGPLRADVHAVLREWGQVG